MLARRSAVFLALALFAAPALAKTAWVNTIAATPEGGIRIGNPNAKVKIVEYASYTCSHCKAFNETAVPVLKAKYIASGNVSFEQRSFVRNIEDLVASLLVTCQAPRPALAFVDKLFAEQDKWTQPFVDMSTADNQAVVMAPTELQPAKKAELAGFDRWADTRGLPLAKSAICLRDKAAQDRLIASRNEAITRHKLTGTPLFLVNGSPVTAIEWGNLEPYINAALK
jgi:protein-disulfide isomerase